MRDISGSDTDIYLRSLFHGSSTPGESYKLYTSGGLLWDHISTHGAEAFNRMLLYTATQSRGSQVPGAISNREWLDNAYSESQFGRDEYKPVGHVSDIGEPTENYGGVAWSQGDTASWDQACQNP